MCNLRRMREQDFKPIIRTAHQGLSYIVRLVVVRVIDPQQHDLRTIGLQHQVFIQQNPDAPFLENLNHFYGIMIPQHGDGIGLNRTTKLNRLLSRRVIIPHRSLPEVPG